MNKILFLLPVILIFSCEEDPIFGLEKGWLRSDESSEEKNTDEGSGDEGSGDEGDTLHVDYTVTLNTPNGGESWETSNIQNIQWETNAPQNSSIGIQLYKNSNYSSNISSQANNTCLLYTSPSPRDGLLSRMPSSA